MPGPRHVLQLGDDQRVQLEDLVLSVRKNCPGQTEFRYLSFIRGLAGIGLQYVADAYQAAAGYPVLVQNLPVFADVEDSKILALLIGEGVGSCVAYSDYNQSYITDIRPTTLSQEKSSGTDLLNMHNDLSWASDKVRPRTLVLVPHVAEGDVPRTLLAPVVEVLARLDEQTHAILRERQFEARSGSSLAWGQERVRRMELLTESDGKPVVRLNFDAFAPVRSLSERDAAAATKAMTQLHDAALEVGKVWGHAVQKGEALIIANDHCAHGREPIDVTACERLLLRSYVVPEVVRSQHLSTMLALSE